LDAPGSGGRARASAEDGARAVQAAWRYLRPWILRPGCCAFCGEPVDPFEASELYLAWVPARRTLEGGGKQGGRNGAPKEAGLGIFMHRPCYDRMRRGVHPDQCLLPT